MELEVKFRDDILLVKLIKITVLTISSQFGVGRKYRKSLFLLSQWLRCNIIIEEGIYVI